MHVAVIHTITDAQKWNENVQKIMAIIEEGRLPEGLNVQMYLPAADGQKGVCLWEAGSTDALKNFLDREIGSAASNEYIAINADGAIGLPGQAAPQATA